MDETKDPNRLFLSRLGNEGKLRILLSQAPSGLQTGGNQDATQGVDNQSRVRSYRRTPDEFVPRKKKGLINFWDLGQIKDTDSGLWVNNDFTFDPLPYVFLSPDPDHSADEIRFATDITLTDVRSYEDTYLAGGLDPSTMETKYRQVPKSAADAFYITATVDGVDFNFDSTEWTDDGLKVTSLSSLVIKAWKRQAGIDVAEMVVQLDTDPLITKCTTGATYASPEISFTPKAGDKWFLSPMLRVSQGTSGVEFGSPALVSQNLFYVTVPRDFTHPSALVQWNPGSDPDSDFALVVPVHQALPGARTFTITQTGLRVTLTPGGTFPRTDPGTENDALGFFAQVAGQLPGGNGTSEAQFIGQLAGICKQGTALYYFWRKTS